jgi:hypothetical protein
MSGDKSLINLGDVSKTASILVEKISDAIGGVFKPYQIVRVARAEAEAEIIRVGAQIKIEDLHRRALHRFLQEEARKQANIEEITRKALPGVNETAKPDELETDWITNFFDKCRIISNEQMQTLWSSLLAGEANVPGSFSKRTVDLLASLDKRDADLFTQLCAFCWMFGYLTPLVFDYQETIYEQHGISFTSLQHLESIGLIQFGSIGGFRRLKLPREFTIFYYGQPLAVRCQNEKDNEVPIGMVMLTQAGKELATITNARPDPAVFEHVKQKWTAMGLIVPAPENTMQPAGEVRGPEVDIPKAG